jgi:[acyl-carrier-protein] S-malonyltransferase
VTAFLFAGQLSEFAGMGKDFYDSSQDARALFDRTSRRCGADIAAALFGGAEDRWRDNRVAQPAVFLVSVLAARELARRRVKPAAVAGYSLGNYAALVAAGAVSFDDALTVLLAVLAESDRREIRGAMGAVIGVSAAGVEEECSRLRSEGRPVWIGNINAATQLVLTGTESGVEAALEALSPRALKAVRLPMTWPIHSPLMDEVCRHVAPVVAACESIRLPEIPLYAGHTAARVTTREGVSELLARQAALPSRWKETVEAMFADGHRDFLEVGPGETLSKMIRWIVRDASCRPVGSLVLIEGLARKGEILNG